MSRVLLAWELGANYGHLVGLAPVAERLRAAGHRLLFAVRDVRGAAEVLGAKGFSFAQAPAFQRRSRSASAPASYAEMLVLQGYADRAALWGMVRAWISLARLFWAEIVVANHSPGALLAGRILGLPRAQIGTGFEIPPSLSPLPSIRPWQNIPEQRLRRSERAVTEVINNVVRSFRGRELERLCDLFDTEARIFTTFAELDPYGPRPNERYTGPVYDRGFGERADWPDDGRPRIFAYLRQSVPKVANILQALKGAPATTICVMPDARPEEVKRDSSGDLRITARPLHLDSVLRQAELALLYGGHGVACAALVAGVPILAAPQNVEQFLHARRVESLGAGTVLGKDRSVETVRLRIEQALADSGLKAKARAFSYQHAGFDPERAVAEAAASIERLAGARAADQIAAQGRGEP